MDAPSLGPFAAKKAHNPPMSSTVCYPSSHAAEFGEPCTMRSNIVILFKMLNRYGISSGVWHRVLQLVAQMCWHFGVGIQREAVGTGTAGFQEFRTFSLGGFSP
jgi:hypothetical protein